MTATVGQVRRLGAAELPAVRALLERDPVTNAFVHARVLAGGVGALLGGELWGFGAGPELESLCYAGANLVPVAATPPAVEAFGYRARGFGRRCSSVWGPREAVEPLWRLLAPYWSRPRAVRADQPFLVLDHPPLVAGDDRVRRVRLDEVDLLYPASVRFFAEELGISPDVLGGGSHYRARVAELVGGGFAFARIEHGRVVFKAELGVATPYAAQIQGVWVPPDRRGEGLATHGIATVAAVALAEVAPVVSLYVNDFNLAARRVYSRVGFRQVSSFMTVLL